MLSTRCRTPDSAVTGVANGVVEAVEHLRGQRLDRWPLPLVSNPSTRLVTLTSVGLPGLGAAGPMSDPSLEGL
jgi:hypothetical protein